MKYTTPQIIDVTPAARAIQSSPEDKGNQTMIDNNTLNNDATVGAYEADE